MPFLPQLRKGLSLLLALTLVTSTSTTWAETPQQLPEKMMDPNDVSFTTSPKSRQELVEHRTSHTKRFLNPDGTLTETIYDQPIHYQDSGNEQWIPIDSNLTSDENGNFENKANRFKVHLQKNANGGFVDFTHEDTTLSFFPRFTNGTKGEVHGEQVRYINVAQDTDLHYTVQGNGLKEDIILKSSNAPNTFAFDLSLGKLSYHLKEDGSVEFYNTGKSEPAFTLAKPYMFDAEKNVSDAVHYEVRKDTNGKTILEVVADSKWLQEQGRSYPVTIDPTIGANSPSLIEDTFVESIDQDGVFHYYQHNLIGNSVNHGITRTMYQFDLPALPTGAVVTDSRLHVVNEFGYVDNQQPVIDVIPILSKWETQTMNWLEADKLAKGNAIHSYTADKLPNLWEIPITNLVKNWYDGVQANYGLELRYRDETLVVRELAASGYGDLSPVVTIDYKIDGFGAKPYWTYDGLVNMGNRNLVLGLIDIAFPGRQVQVDLKRTYNSRSQASGVFGYGWSSVLDMRLYTTAKGPARLVDSEGTAYYFKQNADGTYQPLPGLFWKLSVSGSTATISMPDQTTYTFTGGMLTRVADAAGNGVSIVTSGNQKKIQDDASHAITLTLSDGRVISALDPAGRAFQYSYDGAGNLSKVVRPDGTSESYRYDNAHNLIATVNPKGQVTYHAYNPEDRLISISPTNAIINGNFEVDSDGDATPDTFTYFDGHTGLSIDKGAGSGYGQAAKLSVSAQDPAFYKVYVSKPIPVSPEKSYVLSGKLKAAQTSGTQTTVLSVIAFDDKGLRIGELAKNVLTNASGWQTKFSTMPAGQPTALPAAAKTVVIKVGASNQNGSGTSWFDAIQFEEVAPGAALENTDFVAGDQYTATADSLQSARYDGDGNKELYVYSADQNLIQYRQDPATLDLTTNFVWTDHILTSIQDPRQHRWSYQYDDKGNLTQETDPLGEQSKYTYDAQSNLIESVGPRDAHFLYTYNNQRDQKTSRDPYFTSQAKSHDTYGNVLNETSLLGWADNLLDNSSFEGAVHADGTPIRYVFNSGQSGTWKLSVDAEYGLRSLQIQADSNQAQNFTLLTSDLLAVLPSETYVLSGHVKAERTSGTQETILSLRAYDAAGAYLGEIGRLASNVVMEKWQKWSTAILPGELPATTAYVRVKLAAKNATGTGISYFDAIQLQKNPVDTAYNLVDNSSFEQGSASGVHRWVRSNNIGGTFNWLINPVYAGNRSVAIVNSQGNTGYVYDEFIPFDQAKTYSLTAFVKTDQLSASVAQVRFEQYDANKSKIILQKEVSSPLTGGTGDWKRLGVELSAENMSPNTAYIRPVLGTAGVASGTVYFDNVRLQAERVTADYRYDSTGTRLESTEDLRGGTTQYQYDVAGNLTQTTSPLGRVTKTEYDTRDRVAAVTPPSGNLKIQRRYDANGNVTSIQYGDPSGAITYDETKFTYNSQQLMKSSVDQQGRKREFSYTPAGRIQEIKFVDNGQKISFAYSKTGLLTNTFYDGVNRYTLGYDSSSNVNSAWDSKRQRKWSAEYDALNRFSKWNDGVGFLDYLLDETGNVKQQTLKIGNEIKTQVFEYDLVNQPTKMTDVGGTSRFLFNESGNLSVLKKGNGTVESYSHNSAGQVLQVNNRSQSGAPLSKYLYEYDGDGFIMAVIEPNGTRLEFVYDPQGRLVEEDLANGNHARYEYDPLGNRTKRTESTAAGSQTVTTYQYKQANEIVSVDGKNYSYDRRGYLISDGERSFAWDTGGRLTSVSDSAGHIVASYEYDHLGRRVQQTIGNETTNFLYEGMSKRVVAEYNAAGTLTKYYSWGPGERLLSLTVNGNTYFTVINGHGDIVQLTDATGENVVAWYQYDAWGNLIGHNTDNEIWALNPYRYAGYRYDDNTGLYYLMARFYDPEVGRFLSQDPLSDVPDYKYGANSPLNYVDPDGLQERDTGLCCAGSANIGPYVRTVQNAAAVVGGTIDSANQQSMADSVEPTNRRNYGEIIKRNYQLGVEGEREAGISGVKEQIGSASKKRNYRIPDSIDHKMGTLTEVKNVKKQYLSTQLRDFLSWSEQRNYEFRLVVRQDTKLTGPLKELVDVGRITLIRRLGK